MPEASCLAERRFTSADQDAFASLSGDANPMHVDPIAARRTPAGAAVVHGMHGLLWALDEIARRVSPGPLRAIDADFAQFLYVDEMASLHVTRHDDAACRAELRAGGVRVAQYVLKLGTAGVASPPPARAGGVVVDQGRVTPLDPDPDDTEGAFGDVAHASPDAHAGAAFPSLCGWIGERRVTSLLSLTRLVGMVSPGLHSTFHRVSVGLVTDTLDLGRLVFSTKLSDPRFGVVVMDVCADGIAGTVKASRRQKPTVQPSLAALRAFVPARRFDGRRALVIGGSRGLGEVTAKLLAAGGASVAITFASGAGDAASIVREIVCEGGSATSLRFDCLEDAASQLEALRFEPDSLYFFATPRISSRATSGFSAERFAQFSRIYVEAFHDIVTALASRRTTTLRVFYPSTIFVADATRHMAEYAMAKAAGEVLCADLSRFGARIDPVVRRLPRIATDQTASMVQQDVASPERIMAAIVDEIESGVSQSGEEARSRSSAGSIA